MLTKHIAHQIAYRIYYEDTDAGGLVYYANYLKFAERARTEMLRSLGFEQRKLMEEHGVAFVVRRVLVDYFAPARLDDSITIDTSLHLLKRTQMTLHQRILRGKEVLTSLEVLLACVDQRPKPAPMPESLLNALAKLLPAPEHVPPQEQRH